jgi:zinc transport system permease protein
MLSLPFFQKALIGGALVAVICAAIGLFIILRKESMIGDSVGHTAFGGIAIGLLFGIEPILTAMLVSTFAILAISYMRSKGIAQSDSAMAVMMAAGFAIGLVIIDLAGGFNVDLLSYLFGSVLTISDLDLTVMSVTALMVFGIILLLYKELLAITFDEGASRLSGIPVAAISTAFNILVAVTIVLSIKVVGIILVVALLIIPGLTALQMNQSFRWTIIASILFGIVSVIMGIFISVVLDVATSAAIVLVSLAVFLFVALYQRLG